jgi:predicted metalloprotease with PDZ domain
MPSTTRTLRPSIRVAALAACLAAGLLAALAAPAAAQTPEAIRYTLRFPAPETHYVEIEASVPTGGARSIDLMMPVWTPGSYLEREYERHVENVRATAPDGRTLGVRKTSKNHWAVETGGAPRVTVAYEVYGREMTVRNDWIESRFAMLTGAATFLTLAEPGPRPHEVALVLPAGWKTTMSGLPEVPGAPHTYRAPDFDTLVDCPIVAGNSGVYEFEVAGHKHYLVDTPDSPVFDGARAIKDVERIVRQNLAMWGQLPYDKYVFFNMLTESGGGLEHKNSVMMMTTRWATRTHQRYLGWLGLVSHEFFHAWNVKRLRPRALGPFDYDHENYTPSLWIAEGFTDYYGDLNLVRAGLSTSEEYLRDLSRAIHSLQTTPGRLVQTADMASFDAWIKAYRPDENSANTSISYYTKGSIIAFLLDARIRQATGGAKSLDDVMRLAYQRYSGAHGYTNEEFRQVAQEVAGADLSAWFTRVADTTAELDYTPALDWYGLRFRPVPPPDPDAPARGWLGLRTRDVGGRLVVTQTPRGTPGYEAGLNVDDEILAFDAYRVTPAQLNQMLDYFRPGQKASVLVSRRGELMRLDVTFGRAPDDRWRLEVAPDATAEQRAHFSAWIGR